MSTNTTLRNHLMMQVTNLVCTFGRMKSQIVRQNTLINNLHIANHELNSNSAVERTTVNCMGSLPMIISRNLIKYTKMENAEKQQTKNGKLPIQNVSVPLHVIKQVLKYCEDNQIYDKLGSYQNFYYKLNQIRRECEESNAN